MTKFIFYSVSLAALTLSACTTTGNIERNAAIGAAGGALAGAVIGNNVGDGDAATGAAIGAIVGGAGGAYVGNEKDKNARPIFRPTGQRYYDEQAQRYYYIDAATGHSYWANGQKRG